MKHFVLFAAFACSGAFASDPGQLLDCTDLVTPMPGISCAEAAVQCDNGAPCLGGASTIVDNEHHLVYVRETPLPTGCGNGGMQRTAIVQVDMISGGQTVVAYFDDRCENGCIDHIGPRDDQVPLFADNTNGAVIALLQSFVRDNGSQNCATPQVKYRPMIFSGFTSLMEIFQSFTPQPSSIGFRVPYMPEGMGGADHFDTYWGSLAHPIDFTQAHPLLCGYPMTPPHVGDYFAVADTVPTPAPGQGVYFVTATTYQGQTRYGRKATGGVLSGRDPTLLPACVP